MRILLDNGIFIHSEFAEECFKRVAINWGGTMQTSEVHGLARKPPDQNAEYQEQKEALFALGRLIREGKIEAFDYWEIRCERFRGTPSNQVWNALRGCKIHDCSPAIRRSIFSRSIYFDDVIAKGGKEDVKRGVELRGASQIAFFKRLAAWTIPQINVLISHAPTLQFTQFEIDSLKGIEYFQFLCQRSGSIENYPDIFHLWTAERNGLDAILTLDGKLPRLVSRVKKEKKRRFEIRTEVLKPIELLPRFGINKPDSVPVDANRFYHWHEVT